MIEVVLLKKENSQYIELYNLINSLSQSIRLYKILENPNDIFNTFSNSSIDILIIESSAFKALNIIDFSNLSTYVKYIIILTDNSNITYNNQCIFCNINDISQVLEKLVKKMITNNIDYEDENIIRKRINEELIFIGYNPSYYGTKYLIDCIYYLYSEQNSYNDISMKKIYCILAQKYNKSENTIKCNITRATSIMYCECKEEKLKKYLKMSYLPKTGSRIIIQTVLNNLL